MNIKNKKILSIIASVFIVVLLLSTATAIPMKNSETSILRQKIQNKLDSNEAVKERIKERYPEVYDAVTSGIIMRFPIFCWTMFLVLIIVMSILYDWFLMTEFPIIEELFCEVCYKGV